MPSDDEFIGHQSAHRYLRKHGFLFGPGTMRNNLAPCVNQGPNFPSIYQRDELTAWAIEFMTHKRRAHLLTFPGYTPPPPPRKPVPVPRQPPPRFVPTPRPTPAPAPRQPSVTPRAAWIPPKRSA